MRKNDISDLKKIFKETFFLRFLKNAKRTLKRNFRRHKESLFNYWKIFSDTNV